MKGLSISISNDITGRYNDQNGPPPVTDDFWVTDQGDNMVTDTGDKLIFVQ